MLYPKKEVRAMKDRLLEMLKAASRERPLDRYEAATELFISEREVRRLIAELREQGVRVCSDSRGRGYCRSLRGERGLKVCGSGCLGPAAWVSLPIRERGLKFE